jgi:hypothetical protein
LNVESPSVLFQISYLFVSVFLLHLVVLQHIYHGSFLCFLICCLKNWTLFLFSEVFLSWEYCSRYTNLIYFLISLRMPMNMFFSNFLFLALISVSNNLLCVISFSLCF